MSLMNNFNTKTTGCVLIVDDSPTNVMLLEKILSPEYSILTALSGEKALEITHEHDIDLILLDIIMPNISGLEVLQQLKSQEFTKNIPVIFVTSMDDKEFEIVGLNMGAADYITKPYIPEIVKLRVSLHMNLVHQMRTIEKLVSHDILTGFYNKQSFQNKLLEEFNKAVKFQTNITLILIDVDNFKLFNDEYGYHQGDRYLMLLSEIIRKIPDIISHNLFRLHGKRFAILLPDISTDTAAKIAGKLKSDVQKTPFLLDNDKHFLTISLGVSTKAPIKAQKSQIIYDDATTALHIAKENGKNKIVYL